MVNMTKEKEITLFQNKEIRTKWDKEQEEYYYSVIDVIHVLTDSKNPRDYWYRLKKRESENGIELSTICRQLKLPSSDGKLRITDVATPKQLLTILNYIPSLNKEEFIQWLTTNELQQIDENKQLVQTLLYSGNEGAVTIEVIIDKLNETMWATQKTLSHLFKVDVRDVSYHLQNIFESGELDKNSVFQKIWITATDGKKYNTSVYNLDAIISLGYRINTTEATRFRIWATNILHEYIIKGFALDDDLLKKGTRFGIDYFENLLERIRAIRASERRFYQKITDIYATSYDYNKEAQVTHDFFANVQNKLIYAITEQTAAEIIASRSDSQKPHMGLTTWKNQNDIILLSDIEVSKNYLTEPEIKELNRLVDGLLTIAESRAERQIPTSMQEWVDLVEKYLKLNQTPILQGKGKISSKEAKKIARKEYEKFKPIQDKTYRSDYDKMLEQEIKRIEGQK